MIRKLAPVILFVFFSAFADGAHAMGSEIVRDAIEKVREHHCNLERADREIRNSKEPLPKECQPKEKAADQK